MNQVMIQKKIDRPEYRGLIYRVQIVLQIKQAERRVNRNIPFNISSRMAVGLIPRLSSLSKYTVSSISFILPVSLSH